jgi:ribonuclease-3
VSERLTQKLGYAFRDSALLSRALTHRSASASNYERLEFLGDGLLNFVVGEALFRVRPQAEEGDLSRLRASLVCEDSLAALAEKLQLGEELVLGAGELKSGGFRRHSILADTLEALLGAVYLDGGFDAARDTCLRLFAEPLAQLPDAALLKDAKTRLQEYLQGRGRPLPQYEVRSAQGPAHRQSFTVLCRLTDSPETTEGHAASRRGAEQDAAEQMMKVMEA